MNKSDLLQANEPTAALYSAAGRKRFIFFRHVVEQEILTFSISSHDLRRIVFRQPYQF